jgi:hypothetical protein
MKFYHVTTSDRARTILRQGFADNQDSYGTDQPWSGVWLFDRPLVSNDTANVRADTTLAVSLDCEPDALSDYEWIKERQSCREWLIPSDFVNKRTVAIVVLGTDMLTS